MAEPIYRQIAAELRREITGGEFGPGDRLPKESELEQRFGASRNTVRLALGLLANEGLVRVRHGKGTFVTESVLPLLVTLSSEEGAGAGGRHPGADSYVSAVKIQGRTPAMGKSAVETQKATSFVAERLEIEPGDPVILRTYWRLIDGRPWSIQTSYYPWDIAQGTEIMMPGDIARGTIQVLREQGHEQVGYHDRIWARMPQPEEQGFFEISTGVPVIVLNRTAYSVDRPIRLTRTVYAADRNRLAYDIGKVPESEDRPR